MMPAVTWSIPNNENNIFLSFDDGPHPEITPWVLTQLKKYDAKATFFCLGMHAEKYPGIVKRILEEGHAIGNHGYEHLDGWKISTADFTINLERGEKVLKTRLFRPPYGKIKFVSYFNRDEKTKIMNWSLMPGDFDAEITSEQCLQRLKEAKSGDIICLHDQEKAWKHLQYILPKFLEENTSFAFDTIPVQ